MGGRYKLNGRPTLPLPDVKVPPTLSFPPETPPLAPAPTKLLLISLPSPSLLPPSLRPPLRLDGETAIEVTVEMDREGVDEVAVGVEVEADEDACECERIGGRDGGWRSSLENREFEDGDEEGGSPSPPIRN